MLQFTITAKDKQARTGIITTPNGTIKTPAFIPVATKATLKSLTPKQIEDLGYDSILCNTYHLYLQPGSKTVKKLGKLHNFMQFQKPLFTDSGGFQVFSLNDTAKVSDEGVEFRSVIDQSKHMISPEISMQIQHDLGADIIFTFDECIHFDDTHERTNAAMQRTHMWTQRCVTEHNKLNGQQEVKQALFGIVQGGKYKDLREESAKFIRTLNFPGYGIGGIFGDPTKEIQGIVKHTMQFLEEDKPKHMLGIGSVEDIFDYVEVGADTFDCVLPTRLARQAYFFLTPESGGNLQNKFRDRLNTKSREDATPLDSNCNCYTCKNFTKAYLYHLFRAKEYLFYTLMSYHNLHFFKQLMNQIHKSIENQEFEKLKEKWLT